MTAPPRSARHLDPPHSPIARQPLDEPDQRFTLSATQITASMAAAVTAAMIGSKLGVAGTVIGAGLASVISGVGGAVYGHSISATRKQVKRAVLQVRGVEPEPGTPAAGSTGRDVHVDEPFNDQGDDRTVVIPVMTPWSGPERAEPRRPRPTRRKLITGLLVGTAAAAAIFTGSLAAVTLVETVKGSPLSGGDSGGLSVLGGNNGTDPGTIEVPADSTTQVTVPSTVTQTVTSEPTSPPSSTESSAASATDSTTSTSSAPSSSAPSSNAPSTSSPSTSAPSTSAPSTSAPSSSPAAPGAQ